MSKSKDGYSQLPQDQFGVKTHVTDTSQKGLPTETGESSENNYMSRPSTPDHMEVVLPLAPGHSKGRDQKIPQPSFQGPGGSGEGKKVPVRTVGVPGEEYGHPYIGPENTPMRRRPKQAIPRYPMSQNRQKEQRGVAQRGSIIYYKRNKSKILNKAKQRYRKMKRNPLFQRKKEYYREFTDKYERKPSGGTRDPAERTKEWRETHKTSYLKVKNRPKKRQVKQKGVARWRSRKQYLRNKQKYKTKAKKYYRKYKHVLKRQQKFRRKNPSAFRRRKVGGILLPCCFQTRLGLLEGFVLGVSFSEGFAWVCVECLGFQKVPLFLFLENVTFYTSLMHLKFFQALDRNCGRTAGYTFVRDQKSPETDFLEKGEGTPTWVVPMTGAPGFYDTDKEDKIPGHTLYVPEVRDAPGSAKVIPSNKDFVNKKASLDVKQLIHKLSRQVMKNARGIFPREVRRYRKNGVLVYRVSDYVVRARISEDDKKVSHIACSCPFWKWQGPEHWGKQGGYLLGTPKGTATRPVEKDPNGTHLLCKHAFAVIIKWMKTNKQRG